MLRQLLTLLKGGGNHTIGELASVLGVNQDLVEVMLADLAQHGYLSQIVTDCPAYCTACPLSEFCHPLATISGWEFDFSKATTHGLTE